jgi:hypothetical protein
MQASTFTPHSLRPEHQLAGFLPLARVLFAFRPTDSKTGWNSRGRCKPADPILSLTPLPEPTDIASRELGQYGGQATSRTIEESGLNFHNVRTEYRMHFSEG